jgi:hypothetical protein
MIQLDDTERQDATWQDWRSRCATAQQALDKAMAKHDFASGKPAPKVNSKLYAELKGDHYAALRAPFWSKCAYCETLVSINHRGDIEHFRPKGRISDPDTNKPIRVNTGTHEHPGYYWLAYDWKNLLLACELKDGRRIGKWDHFPLADESKRAEQPGDEVHEDPLLINPLVEDPSAHLDLDPKTGVLSAKGNSPRGQACINLLGLNDRGLPDERHEAYDAAKNLYLKYVLSLLSENQAEETTSARKIEAIDAGSCSFAMARRMALAESRRLLASSK